MLKIRKGDDVIVRSGKYKGQKGTVEKVLREEGKVVVKGVNVVKRHVSAKVTGGKEGTILEITKPLPISVVSILNDKDQKTRVKFVLKEGKKVRVAVKGGAVIS